ncbi:MAG: SusC/RagA family TonB-linked outer membrane protein [Pseudobacter sp.]|uniref:SusC/RagA family TonB-linked outer membrane protein n=1 Tax=Pseudobacter sp. TaxID=2045420 RepID=UPI003F7D1222
MRKSLLLMIVLLTGTLAWAQQAVRGTVSNEKGEPVPFATVTETGTKNTVQADASGNFSISIKTSGKITVTATGHQPQTITPTGATVAVKLSFGDAQLSEVVVTALGVRKSRNQVAYAAQQIVGDEVSKTRTSNFIQNLSGKVAGLDIKQGNTIGASSNVVMRGIKSIAGNNQVLFVVDGIPYNNSGGTTPNQTADRNNAGGGYDYGNAAADINPDDVASLTVLKGAAASALYGSQGANGVILITTKKGTRGLGITLNSSVTVGKYDPKTFPKYQKEYGQGYNPAVIYEDPTGLFWYRDIDGDGTPDLVAPLSEDASYGAKFDPSLMVYQWDAFDPASPNFNKKRPWVAGANDPSKMMQTAVSSNQSVFLDGATDKGHFKMGYTRTDDWGILPNSRISKNLLNVSGSYNISDKVTANANLSFSNVSGKGRYGTGYDGSGSRNLMTSFRQWWNVGVDILEQKDAYFRNHKNSSWNIKGEDLYAQVPNFWDNPYWVRYQNFETDVRNRYFGNVSLNYQINDWLSLMGRVALDGYDELIEERRAIGSNNIPSYSRFNRSFRETNLDLMLNVNKDLNEELNLKALLGANIRRQHITYIRARTNGGLIVPNIYAVSNSLATPDAPEEFDGKKEVDGVFAGATMTWKDMVTLDATIRRDQSSTLPEGNNAYYYPSVSLGWVFSKLLPQASWLSYGKLRTNYAQVGNDAPVYAVHDAYGVVTPFGSRPQAAATGPNYNYTKNNPNLLPEKTVSLEGGLELAFLKNRLSLDVSYYRTRTQDQILPVELSTTTGYSYKYLNAGTVENKGIELMLSATPVKTRDFSWTLTFNYAANRNKVLELHEGADNLKLGDYQGGVTLNASLGDAFGTIRGNDFIYTNGQRTVSATSGRYQRTSHSNAKIGNINPDWLGGINNAFRYKNFSASFLVDIRKGGDIFSLDMYYGLSTGIYAETAGLNDQGKPSRAPLADGGGIVLPGVTPDGKVNERRVLNGYGTYGDYRNPAAGFVYDGSYVKLREVMLSYTLPQELVNRMPVFKGVELGIAGRNLWIIDKNLPHADPEDTMGAGNLQGYQSGSYPAVKTVTFNLKLRF